MNMLSLQRALRIHEVRHQERMRTLSVSSRDHQQIEQRVSASAKVLWKHAVSSTSAPREDGVVKGAGSAHLMLAHAYDELQKGARALRDQDMLLTQARRSVAESEAAMSRLDDLVRARTRHDLLQAEEQQNEELVELASNLRAVTPQGVLSLASEASRSSSLVANDSTERISGSLFFCRDVPPCDAATRGRSSSDSEIAGSGIGAATVAGDGGGMALCLEGALQYGRVVSIEVRQNEKNLIDATILVNDSALLSLVVSERKQLLAKLGAAHLEVDTLDVVTRGDDSGGAGSSQRGRRRSRSLEVGEDDDEITLA